MSRPTSFDKKDLLVFLILLLFAPLYFYNLSGHSLVDFDEAWFGEIAKNILKSGQPFMPTFNGLPFWDHPPFGFIAMAASIAIFGANEFAVRLPSAISGFLSLIFTYLIGKKLFGRTVGLGAALILTSYVWLVLRARTGNLDTLLVFLFLASFYIATKIKDNVNFIFLLPFSLVALLLTKSMIGLVIIPPIIAYLFLNKVKVPAQKALLSALLFLILLAPWFFQNYQKYQLEFINKMVAIGVRTGTKQPINFSEIHKSVTFTYLHYGIRKWYYPAIIAAVASLYFVRKEKNLIPFYLWIVILLYGFLTSKKTEIWHLLPLYPPLALLISFCIYRFGNFVIKNKLILSALTLGSLMFVSLYQINGFKGEIKLFGHDESGLAKTAKAAQKYPEKLYLDSDLIIPAVVAFYSDKKVNTIRLEPEQQNTLLELFENTPRPYIVIVEKWKLDLDKINPQDYQILSEHQGHLLVKVI